MHLLSFIIATSLACSISGKFFWSWRALNTHYFWQRQRSKSRQHELFPLLREEPHSVLTIHSIWREHRRPPTSPPPHTSPYKRPPSGPPYNLQISPLQERIQRYPMGIHWSLDPLEGRTTLRVWVQDAWNCCKRSWQRPSSLWEPFHCPLTILIYALNNVTTGTPIQMAELANTLTSGQGSSMAQLRVWPAAWYAYLYTRNNQFLTLVS